MKINVILVYSTTFSEYFVSAGVLYNYDNSSNSTSVAPNLCYGTARLLSPVIFKEYRRYLGSHKARGTL